MPTLLIVDDEMPQVRALSAIISKMRPKYEIVARTDGESAWQAIRQRPVDALITDIRMPNMDGMELIDRVHRYNPQLKLILLSGYGQFEYAQEAIRCNVLEYLIKPIGQEAIHRVIEKLEAKWEEDKQRRLTESLFRGTLWRKLFEGKMNPEEYAELKKTVVKDGPGLALTLDFPEAAAPFAKGELENELERRFSVLASQAVFHSSSISRRFVGMLWLSPYYSVRASESYGKIRAIVDDVVNSAELALSSGVSDVHPNLFENAEKAYQEAQLAASLAFYETNQPLIRYSAIHEFVDPNSHNVSFSAARIAEGIRSGNRQLVSEDIHHWITDELKRRRLSPEHFKTECANNLIQVLNKLDSLIQESEKHRLSEKARQSMASAKDWMELRSRTMDWINEVADGVQQLLGDTHGTIIKRCQEYMRMHFNEDLSLERVSAKFSFNASYFSNYFKMKTGTRFSDYLLGIRVGKAKEMLLNSSELIEDIAHEVGFSNSAYFIRMFKRETGVSPAAFRRLSGSR
ncbi:response regulator [Cohnella suwonensis]|uniref:Response regulator n=1 Tax=Cohnella suwonensis TaxID=696072 RepID=A0ABW0M0N5_9BACL